MSDRIYTARELAQRRWRQMIYRCTDPKNPAWNDYGGRGIKVCPEWMDFDTYYRDVGDKPTGKSLDRIDNDGDYEPGNVRWATPVEQRANRRHDPMASKTHCKQGHPYSGDNLYIARDGRRHCRTCRTAWQQAARATQNSLPASAGQGKRKSKKEQAA